MENDIPILKEVIGSVFKKEPELKDMKSQLDSLNRQINLLLENKEQDKIQTVEEDQKNSPLIKDYFNTQFRGIKI